MRSLARITALCLTGLLLALAPGRSQADEPGKAVDRVIAAFDARDAVKLAELAGEIHAQIGSGRWDLADALCIRQRHDAAAAFAQAMPAPEGAKLAAYLQQRGTGDVDPAVRDALVAVAQAHDSQARQAVLKRLRELSTKGDAFEQARVALAIGLVLHDLGRAGEAVEALQAAGERAAALGWLQGAAMAWMRAGLNAWAEYDAGAARDAWQKHRATEAQRGSLDGQLRALNNLGSLSVLLGDFPGAERDYGLAFKAQAAMGAGAPKALQGELLMNMAESALRSGRFTLATQRIAAALRMTAEDETSRARARALSIQGTISQDLGDAEDALRLLKQAESVYAQLHERAKAQDPRAVTSTRLQLARARVNRAILLDEMARPQAALPLLAEARTTFASLGATADEERLLDNLGLVLLALGRRPEAVQTFQDAIRLAEKIGDRWAQTNAVQNLADARLAGGEKAKALELHAQALKAAEGMFALRLIADGHGGMARVHLALGEPKQALAAARKGADALILALGGLATPQGPHARERNTAIFEAGVGAALALDDTESAAWFAERDRAATLLQALQGREEVRDTLVPKKLLAEERAVERAVAEARSLMERAEADAREGATIVSRQRAKERYRRFKKELDGALGRQRGVASSILRASHAAATVLYGRVDALDTIKARLVEGDALVAYAFTRGGVAAVVCHASGAHVVDLGSQKALEASLRRVQWSNADEPVAATRLDALRSLLVTPLKLPEGTRRLLVSPVGSLAFFPFGALLPYMQVAYVPSGTAHGMLLAEASKRGTGVLGLGGPDYEGRPRLPRLDGSAAEVTHVATRRLLGAKATETNLRAVLDEDHRWQALHLACHGRADPTHPLRSALALTRGADPTDDGYLTALEVLRLHVRADLTVLSACVTGQGRYFRGEGLVGLPRAFLVAGSPRVIASLWRVSDRATAELMKRFYELWRPKDPKQKALPAAEALRRAQADIRDRPGWEHPYYWAAWVLWGLPD